MARPFSTTPFSCSVSSVVDYCRMSRFSRSSLNTPPLNSPPPSDRMHSTTDDFVLSRMPVRNRLNVAPASDFCFMKYVQPKREKWSFMSMIYSAPPTDWVGLGPDRSTNARCKGRSEREITIFQRGWPLLFDVERPRQARKSLVKQKPSCPAVSCKTPGWACAHDTYLS